MYSGFSKIYPGHHILEMNKLYVQAGIRYADGFSENVSSSYILEMSKLYAQMGFQKIYPVHIF